MPTLGFVPLSTDLLDGLRDVVGPAGVIVDEGGVETLSKDYYWYSPVLSARLEDRRASAAVKVTSLAELRAVVAQTATARVPITVRGGATGNYGQCIPLYGGLVIDLSGMNQILSIEEGVVTAEPGTRLGSVEVAARAQGWELRCYPSTWVKSSIAGFLGGGSGGIGSISWGGLSAPGTIKRMKLLTIEETPRVVTLDEAETLTAFHGYGTNGIMVEVQMRLAPAYPWEQIVVGSSDWDRLLDFADEIARDDRVRKRLVSVLENPIPSFFKPIKKFYPDDMSLIFFEIDAAMSEEVKTRAQAAGLDVPHTIAAHEPRRPPMLSDYTWNHTTLWAIKADKSWTYIQSGFRENFREQIKQVQAAFPGEVLFHLEFTKNVPAGGSHAVVGAGGIPLVKFTTEERLKEIITFCRSIGIGIADPHTCYVEDGWTHFDFTRHHALKRETDPHGLLNPGKMKNYADDPFARGMPDPKFLFT